jgi:peptidoglycan/xylan/chitin deacetylase (PgdA/CDA1 family)
LDVILGRAAQPVPKRLAETLHGGQTVVSVTFDDGWADWYTNARSILAAHATKATFYVNSNRIGTSGFLTWAQLEALHADGHEIGGHTLDHVDITQVSVEEARRQVGDDRATLVGRGFAVESFAYPYGEYNARAQSIVQDCGYASGRAAWGLRNLDVPRGDFRPSGGSIQPEVWYGIPTLCCIRSTTSLATLQNHILGAENSTRGWVPLVLHRVGDDCGDRPAHSISPATLDGLLDWLQGRAANGTVVRTIAEVVGDDRRTAPSAARTAA